MTETREWRTGAGRREYNNSTGAEQWRGWNGVGEGERERNSRALLLPGPLISPNENLHSISRAKWEERRNIINCLASGRSPRVGESDSLGLRLETFDNALMNVSRSHLTERAENGLFEIFYFFSFAFDARTILRDRCAVINCTICLCRIEWRIEWDLHLIWLILHDALFVLSNVTLHFVINVSRIFCCKFFRVFLMMF